jgi:hypothetical protein
MPGGKGNIKPSDGKQFSKDYQPNEKWTESIAVELGNDLIAWLKDADENIFFEDFLYLSCDESKYIGRISTTLPAYLAKKFTSFSNILSQAKKIQEIKLKKFGAFDKLNASIVKFLLSAEYGYTEKSEVKTEGEVNIIIE